MCVGIHISTHTLKICFYPYPPLRNLEKVEKINPYHNDSRQKEKQVEAMFDAIAPAYDFMNRAMTFGLDRLWLRRLLAEASACMPGDIADLATGTGDVALALSRRIPAAKVTGIDLSEGMLDKAREKAATQGADIDFRQADCLDTGLPDSSFDLVTIAYGVRNFADIAAGYREMARILRPGGKLAVLELSTPTAAWTKPFYKLYTRSLIPLAGSLIAGDRSAYAYLPESIAAAPQRQRMTALMEDAGLENASFRSLTLGVCTLYIAFKPRL